MSPDGASRKLRTPAPTIGLRAAGTTVAAFGLAALVGWTTRHVELASAASGMIPMAPSTALLFVLHGIVVCLRAGPVSGSRALHASRGLSVVGGVIALILLALSSLGLHSDVERLGFASFGSIGEVPTGHISPVTAACFLLASVSSIVLGSKSSAKRLRVGSAVCGALLFCVSGVFLLAYLYGNPLLYGGPIIPPALTTAFAFGILGAALFVLAIRRPETTPAEPGFAARSRAFGVLLVTFVVLGAGLVASGLFYSRSQVRRHRAHVEGQLTAVAELKVGELGAWKKERVADATVFADNAGFIALMKRRLDAKSNAEAEVELRGWLARYQSAKGYDRVALLDAQGAEITSTPVEGSPLGGQVELRAREALHTGKLSFVDFYRDSPGQPVFLSVLVPIVDRASGDRPLAVLVLRTDPSKWLYPFIQRWPAQSQTAETLLVRRDGDGALFLNELKFRRNTALELKSPLTDHRMPAVMAALGHEGIVEGVDYRRVPVVACVRAVPDSPWFLVARIDAAEVYSPLGERLWQTVLAVALLLCGAATVLGLVYRQQRLALERRYRGALDSMIEGAQIFGTDWRYVYVNESAAKSGRHTASELVGRTLQEAYPGIETTPMFEALNRCMQDRTATHAEFDFSLPDGEKRWFEFGIQAVPEGLFVLSLDITDRKLSEEAMRDKDARIVHLNAVLRGIRNVNQLITRERDPQVLVRRACELMVESRGFVACSIVLRDGDRIKHVADAGAQSKLCALRRMFERGELPQCVRDALAQAGPVARHDPATSCPECPVNWDYSVRRDTVAVRLENEGTVLGAMLVSVPAGMASDPEELDLLQEIAGDVAFALRGIERIAERSRALAEIESLARFPSEDPNPVLRFAADGRILVANASTKALLDQWRCEIGGQPPEEIRCLVRRALEAGARQETVVEGGQGRNYLLALAPIQPSGYVNGYGMDVTERVHAELDALRLNGRLLRLAQVVQDLSQARNLDSITAVVRRAARDLVGSDGATFVLRDGNLCHYVDEDAIGPLWKGERFPMDRCISGWVMIHKQPAVIEDIYEDERVPHDAYRPTFVRSLVMMPIRSKKPIGAIGTYWRTRYRATSEELHILQALADSTSVALENVRAYQDLEESEARTRAIYEHLPSPTLVWRKDAQGFALAAFNAAARTVTQGGIANFLDRSATELPHSFPHLIEDLERCIFDRAPFRREVEYSPMGSKTPRWLIATYGFVPPSMVVLHVEDVTEQRQTEEQLRMSQRMEAIGRLAGGVAHDFNNLLSVILNYSSLAFDALRTDDPLREDLQEIHSAGKRAATLTRQLLAFSRKQILQPCVLNLNTIVGDTEGMLRRLIGEDIDLATVLDPELGNVKVDRGQVEQVIMNLVVNSRDAMPDGGKLTIETANAELDQQYAAEHVATTPGSYVMLSVSDTGCGMDEATKARVFEPFFTTKEMGKGTGLGLATVYGIVKQSGGNIWVYSEPGRGTTFKVYLPRELSGAEIASRDAAIAERFTGTESLLLVEDDAWVRALTARILRDAGYSVLVAEDGAGAIAVGQSHEGPIPLLLTDVVMPLMSGRALAEKMAAIRPGIHVLFMSGYTDNAIVHHGVLDPGMHFIGKPFSATELTRKVREVLDAVRHPQTEGSE